jgi:Uma2 family endonuclease
VGVLAWFDVTLAARQRYSFAEYVALEAISPVRHEYFDGQVWAMAGGSPSHAAIAVSVASLLRAGLRGRPCRVFGSDLRIRVRATGLGTYPDVSVVCESLELDPEDAKGHTVVNPILVVEVLSPSTEDYDRGEKLAAFKRIASLREVVLVAHDERRLEIWRRVGAIWTTEIVRGDAVARLESVSCDLPLGEVYDGAGV